VSTTIQTARPRGAHRARATTTPPTPLAEATKPAAAAAPAGAGAARHRAGAGRAVRVAGAVGTGLVNLLLAVALLALLGLAVGPRLLPYRTTTMLTGSMVPLIDPGDVAVVVAEPAARVRPGDVLTIQAPTDDHRVVTHRVIEVKHTDAGIFIRTKGDANGGADPWLAKLEGDTVWRYRFTIPHLGTAIRTLRSPLAHTVLVLGVPAVLVLWVLVGVWKDET
jgi:signal peptidase I